MRERARNGEGERTDRGGEGERVFETRGSTKSSAWRAEKKHTLNTEVKSNMPSAGTSKDMQQRLPGPTSLLLSPAVAAAVCFDLALDRLARKRNR